MNDETYLKATVGPVYHGTNASFKEFKKGIGVQFNNPQRVLGFFFAENIKYAGQYGKNIITAHLSITNPFNAPSSRIDAIEGASVRNARAWVKRIKDKGYDGIKFGDGVTAEWVAFRSDQIKIINTTPRIMENLFYRLYESISEERDYDKNPRDWLRKWDREKYQELQNRFRNMSNDAGQPARVVNDLTPSEYVAHARLEPDAGELDAIDWVPKAQVFIIKPNSLGRRRNRTFDTMDEAQEWISTQNFTIVSGEDFFEAERNNLDRMNAKRNATIQRYKENPKKRDYNKNPRETYQELQNRFRNMSKG